MTSSSRITKWVLLLLGVAMTSNADTRFFVKMRTNASDLFRTKQEHHQRTFPTIAILRNDERMIRDDPPSPQIERRNSFESSTFNPDVLNQFLEDYANKIKSTTERDFQSYPFRVTKPTVEPLALEVDDKLPHSATTISDHDGKFNSNLENSTLVESDEVLNDTIKRNKYYGSGPQDDRNGWVTLDAIPWSKSKISKWQANLSTQRPWPDINNKWDKPNTAKPWPSPDYSASRPTYENNRPWYDKPKPSWQDNAERPWQKPQQQQQSRPPYYDKYDDEVDQAQKWPPERPTWDKYTNNQRPGPGSGDIITDDKPSNFPNNYRPPPRPSYPFDDRYDKPQGQSSEGLGNWQDFPTRFGERPRPGSNQDDRPHFSHYQYVNNHPPSHPANGDGQWVLLSTNRGYSKSRQRSIKLDGLDPESMQRLYNLTARPSDRKEEQDPAIPVMTSKRQVRLTVLPSINGTNTTTSHGGLLEVEKTFKSVDQSRNEYERQKLLTQSVNLASRPIRNTLAQRLPSNSAVLAAVGAGMLPATMAMMIPMMLGRRKREAKTPNLGGPRPMLDFRFTKPTKRLLRL
ncbi:uncharacterized protein [Prorops nasuta]|uniref:uncharacterized protein n=1 Tax=Prorops nasuta TaxID=863751 RepID=UPI0034CE3642